MAHVQGCSADRVPLCAAVKETEKVMMQRVLVPPSVQLVCAHDIHFNCLSTVLACSICVTTGLCVLWL